MYTYETLTIKTHAGTTIGVIESIDGSLSVKYTNTNSLRMALDNFLEKGINVKRIDNNSAINILSKPSDKDFLEKLSQYLQLTFDYFPLIKQTDEIRSKATSTVPQIYGTVGYKSVKKYEDSQWLYDVSIGKTITEFYFGMSENYAINDIWSLGPEKTNELKVAVGWN
jgi:hypothetical protein